MKLSRIACRYFVLNDMQNVFKLIIMRMINLTIVYKFNT